MHDQGSRRQEDSSLTPSTKALYDEMSVWRFGSRPCWREPHRYSSNSGIPLARMHMENANILVGSCTGGSPPRTAEAEVRYALHVLIEMLPLGFWGRRRWGT